jgi:hypothetical protein
MRSPGRKRAIKEKEALDAQPSLSNTPDPDSFHPNTASHAPAATEFDGVAPVREKS